MSKRALIASICALLVAAPAFASGVHVVKYRESACSIASQYGVPVADLVAANRLPNSRCLRVGQRLVIPGAEAAVAAQPAPQVPPAVAALTAPAPVSELALASAPRPLPVGWSEPVSAPAPSLTTSGNDLSLGLVLGLLAKLGLVLALAYGASLGLRRLQAGKLSLGPRSEHLKVVETVPLGQNRSLHVIAVGSRHLLVGSTPQQVGLLGDVTRDLRLGSPTAPEPAPERTDDFTARLLQLLHRAPAAGAANAVPATPGEYRRPGQAQGLAASRMGTSAR